MKKLLTCVLAFVMIFGTCTTSFASPFTDEQVAYVEGFVDNAKAEIDEIIAIAENGTDAQKEEKLNEYIDAVQDALVVVGFNEDKINEVETEIRGEIAEIVAIVEAGNIEAADDKVDAYIEYVKSLFELTAEEDAIVDETVDKIKDEIGEIAGIVDAQDDEAAKAKIDAYINFLKETLDITAEDEAKVAEIVADINALVEEIKGISAEEAKAVVDSFVADLKAKATLEYAKLGHKHYEADANSLYVALGANAEGITRQDSAYYELVAEELLPDEAAVNYSVDWADVANADLITYQVDAADVLLGALTAEVNWSQYFTAEQLAVIETVWAQAAEIVAKDWAAEGATICTDIANRIKAAVMEKLPATTQIEEADIDSVINFCMPYITSILDYVEGKKDDAVAKIPAADDMIWDYAEKVAYAVVAYVVDTKATIEEIQAINPDAALVVLGMYNNFDGLEVVLDGTTIDAGEYFGYLVEATNLYYLVLAAANGDFAFVNIDEADVNGTTIAVTDDIAALAGTVTTIVADITANADGHVYIKDQIMNAFVCDNSAYEQYNETYHYIACALCGNKATTEVHSFVANTCDKCGYTKPASSPVYSSGGGGGITNMFTVKFETNGGSQIDSVKVKRKELVAEPVAPTKEGFVFAGWYTDKNLTTKYDFSTPVTKSFTLYAKWDKVDALTKIADLDQSAWYYDYVKKIMELGLMKGVSDTEFAPNLTLTRGMFVTILHRVEGEPAVENGVSFTDVADDQYYANAVKWANANGIVKGVSDTEFAPNAEVTREQMAAMLARYVEYKKIAVEAEGDVTYTDSDQISEYAKEAVKVANKLGVLIGNTDGSFAPKKNATRAEAAALFVRLLDVLAK